MNLLDLQSYRFRYKDPSQAYSSYTFFDPSTPIARAYLGDLVKTRLVHGVLEIFLVHYSFVALVDVFTNLETC